MLSEAFFLLSQSESASAGLRGILTDRALEVHSMGGEQVAVMKLLAKYRSVPMSFADGCLVRMSELLPKAVVATLDSEFLVYRRLGRQVIPVLMP